MEIIKVFKNQLNYYFHYLDGAYVDIVVMATIKVLSIGNGNYLVQVIFLIQKYIYRTFIIF